MSRVRSRRHAERIIRTKSGTRNETSPALAFDVGQLADSLDRITRLLATLAVKGESQTEKIKTLSTAGFSASEIAHLVDTSANTVSVTLYQSKRSAKRGAKRGS